MAASVHIYALSKLVHASPANWESALNAIEKKKRLAYGYYLPLREAVVLYCKTKGKRQDEILAQLEERARAVIAPKGSDPLRDNKAAFRVFVEKFYPRIGRFQKSLLGGDGSGSCDFTGVQLLGAPHFIASDQKGEDRYVYLLASKWEEDDLKSYLELLAIVITAKYGAVPKSIWCMDLRNGEDFAWKTSSRIRGRCEKAAKLYARFIQAMSAE